MVAEGSKGVAAGGPAHPETSKRRKRNTHREKIFIPEIITKQRDERFHRSVAEESYRANYLFTSTMKLPHPQFTLSWLVWIPTVLGWLWLLSRFRFPSGSGFTRGLTWRLIRGRIRRWVCGNSWRRIGW